nr:MAG TPA: peptidoglycan hydrolase [Caudoviricetes sp.]
MPKMIPAPKMNLCIVQTLSVLAVEKVKIMSNQEFITDIAAYVQKYAASYGILIHSPIIAQAILESGWGKSKLAATYHNYFGLKCGTKWTGKSVNLSTQEEYTAGTLSTIKDNFRVFDSMEEGVKGYFEFIQLARYQNLKGITDPKTYLETIKADGYATSSTYVQNTYALVLQYSLTQYDGKEVNTMGKTAQDVLNVMRSWTGYSEANGKHKEIIDLYNSVKPLPRGYAVQYNDEWCDTTVSAAAIKAGCSELIGRECGVERHVDIFKSMGIWIEDGRITPQPGDIIVYNWDDATQPNDGYSDHIGYVEAVSGGTITAIEGNKGEAVGRRTIPVGWGYIRGFARPKYASSGSSTIKKSVTEVAKEVLAGAWGNGDARKNALIAAGYDYAAVQAKVNELVSDTASSLSKSVEEVAKEVIAGKWSNGDARKTALENAGYNYIEVQKKVNELCGASSVDYTAIAKEVIAGKWGNGSTRKSKLTAAGYDYGKVQAKVNEILS